MSALSALNCIVFGLVAPAYWGPNFTSFIEEKSSFFHTKLQT
jgi:hypothetical protein